MKAKFFYATFVIKKIIDAVTLAADQTIQYIYVRFLCVFSIIISQNSGKLHQFFAACPTIFMTAAEYNETVGLYANRLLRFVIKTMNDATEAEDIVQNSFAVLWTNIEKVPPDKAKSYLFTIAHRRSIDHIRKHKRIALTDEPEAYSTGFATDETERTALREQLDRALATLSEVQRAAILLRDYEGFSYQEIGEQLEISESQVKVYIFRGRQKLQALLQHVRNN